MTWATKDTNKKLELVPDKDPTCGGLVPLPPPAEGGAHVDLTGYSDYVSLTETVDMTATAATMAPDVYYDKAALDVLKKATDFYRPEAKSISPFAGPYGPGSLVEAYPSRLYPMHTYPWEHESEVDELRKDIANLRREISELREELRRSIRPKYSTYVDHSYPYPDTPAMDPIPAKKGKTIKWPF